MAALWVQQGERGCFPKAWLGVAAPGAAQGPGSVPRQSWEGQEALGALGGHCQGRGGTAGLELLGLVWITWGDPRLGADGAEAAGPPQPPDTEESGTGG